LAWFCYHAKFPADERLEIAPADSGAFMPTSFQISRATPQLKNLAIRLISYETNGNKSSGKINPAAFQILEMLRPHLAALMGNGGSRALLSRALVLANAEVPWLRMMYVNADGSLQELEQARTRHEPDEFLRGRVVLLAQLLGMLVALIGESLTLHLVREVWPKVPLNNLGFANGVNDEKAK
jgi:hypothetical protein